MRITSPELGPKGWITDPLYILNTGFTNLCSSVHSQSTIFYGKISSLQKVTAEHFNHPDNLASAMQTVIEEYYSKFFNEVSCMATVEDMDDSQFRIMLSVVVTTGDGKTFGLKEALEIKDGAFNRVIDHLNREA